MAEPVQVVNVRVVVDELRWPRDLRARRAVGRARTQGCAALRRVNHALDGPRFAARHEAAADEGVLKPVTLLAFNMTDGHALVHALRCRALLVRGEFGERPGERGLVPHAEDEDAALALARPELRDAELRAERAE